MQTGRRVRQVLAVALLIGAAWLMVGLVADLNRVKILKTDLAEIHHVRYGLLDADVWVARIGEILEKRVDELDLTEASRAQVTEAVTQLLDTLIREIERNLAQRRPDPGGSWLDQLQGALQQGLQDLLLDVARLRDRVPEYADAFVEQLSVPGVKEQIKARLRVLLRDAVASSGAGTDRRPLEAVLVRYGCADVDACSRLIETEIDMVQPRIRQQLGAVIGLTALVFMVSLVGGAPRGRGSDRTTDRLAPVLLFALVGATFLLLVGGLATPMIEVDARIAELAFQLLGEPVVFTDQVLYFQTKSIFDVMRILFESGQADMLLVAVLLTLFSVVFPALKLLGTYAFYYDWSGSRGSSIVRFFALKSGKWSMADVMVVAIFMAYIGFDALVGNQLGSLRGASDAVAVLTTNGTSLEPGFYLFLGFVLAGLVLSSALENRLDRDG
ncbi:paraquat-inducible protein A [Thiocapsa bogorovii]|uniref:paraquat-inducible protein A n=1 Tax=Thiocapsa bogorovii TaxID=521689 RepID=UPI001E5389C8|nr:paraquat-inducible protein A [Thiocapsa bogorovii]UHD18015.1 paraquat-inducible protein A [Thiocapsa bogorovii]